MVLDAYSTIFVWMGNKANKAEKTNAGRKVEKYIGTLTDGREPSKVQMVALDPGSEP